MAVPKTKTPRVFRDSFAVMCEVGRVELRHDAPQPAHVAAFTLIGEHDAPGTYTFPLENGDVCRVTVEHDHADA